MENSQEQYNSTQRRNAKGNIFEDVGKDLILKLFKIQKLSTNDTASTNKTTAASLTGNRQYTVLEKMETNNLISNMEKQKPKIVRSVSCAYLNRSTFCPDFYVTNTTIRRNGKADIWENSTSNQQKQVRDWFSVNYKSDCGILSF